MFYSAYICKLIFLTALMKLLNPLIILRILSTILLIEAILFIVCIPVALIYGENLLPFILSSAITGIIYLVLHLTTRDADIIK